MKSHKITVSKTGLDMSFPPIYVISLKRTPERSLQMQRQLDAFGLDYQFVDAVDAYDLRSKSYRRALASQLDIDAIHFELCCPGPLTGCALSHVKVYDLMVKNNIPSACILEDDGYLLSSFPNVLVASQKMSWDILMLSHQTAAIRHIVGGFPYTLINKPKFKILRFIYYLLRLMVHLRFNPFVMRSVWMKLLRQNARLLLSEEERTRMRRMYFTGCYQELYGCELGAAPVWGKSFLCRPISGHYIAKPYIKDIRTIPTSAMAYLVTQSAALKWKRAVISFPRDPVDIFPGTYLKNKENVDLRICVPPCVVPIPNYLYSYSAAKHQVKDVKFRT